MVVNDIPKLVLHRETLWILSDRRPPQGPNPEAMPPRSRPVAVATCYTCVATCTC